MKDTVRFVLASTAYFKACVVYTSAVLYVFWLFILASVYDVEASWLTDPGSDSVSGSVSFPQQSSSSGARQAAACTSRLMSSTHPEIVVPSGTGPLHCFQRRWMHCCCPQFRLLHSCNVEKHRQTFLMNSQRCCDMSPFQPGGFYSVHSFQSLLHCFLDRWSLLQ